MISTAHNALSQSPWAYPAGDMPVDKTGHLAGVSPLSGYCPHPSLYPRFIDAFESFVSLSHAPSAAGERRGKMGVLRRL